MTRAIVSLVLASLATTAMGCGSPPTGGTGGAAPKATTIRFELRPTPDATDLARLMAMDELRARGYTIATIPYANNMLVFLGMQRGDVDVASVPDVIGWNAIHRGAPAFVLMDESRMTVLLLAGAGIRRCADLDGKPVAIGAVGGAMAVLTERYVARDCPDAHPQYVEVTGGSATRLAALASGAVAATPLELYDYVEMPEALASKLHALVWFSDVFPGLTTISTFMRRGLSDEHPETARDVVRAILRARRRLQEPGVLAAELTARFGLDAERARLTADTFLTRRVWDVNGSYTMDAIQRNIDFYATSGNLPAGMQAGEVADLSFLNAVLKEIGRQ